jgi:hypothetical protein
MEEKSYLKDKKIVVKFVGKSGGFNNQPGHLLSGGKMQGTYTRFGPPMNPTGSIKEFLTKDETEFFSARLGENVSTTNKEFWDNFSISLTKEDMVLDLSDPVQNLQYRALHYFNTIICTNPADLTKRATYQWCLYNTDDETLTKKSELDSQRKAYINYGRFEQNRDVLCYLYKNIEGRLISRDTGMSDIQSKFLDILSKKFIKFNQLVEDRLLEEKVIINTAYERGILSEKSGEYFDIKTGKKLATEGRATLQVAAEYLAEAVNQDLRLELEARTKIAKD